MTLLMLLRSTPAAGSACRICSSNGLAAPTRWRSTTAGDVTIQERIPSREQLTFEVNKLGWRADGACLASVGDTSVASYVTSLDHDNRMQVQYDDKRLFVNYNNRSNAVNRIPLRFERGRDFHSRKTSSVIDRSVRSLLKASPTSNTNIVTFPFSLDERRSCDDIAINAVSASLTISDVPFDGPVGAVRIGIVDGEVTVGPSMADLMSGELDMLYSGTRDGTVMVNMSSLNGVSIETISKSLRLAHDAVLEPNGSIDAQDKLKNLVGKDDRVVLRNSLEKAMQARVTALSGDAIDDILNKPDSDVTEMRMALAELRDYSQEHLKIHFTFAKLSEIDSVFDSLVMSKIRQKILKNRSRHDGRGLQDLRDVVIDSQPFSSLHGSAIASIGDSQSVATTAIETYKSEDDTIFSITYESPPYITNSLREQQEVIKVRDECFLVNAFEGVVTKAVPRKTQLLHTMISLDSSDGSINTAAALAAAASLTNAGVPVTPAVVITCGVVVGNKEEVGDSTSQVDFLLDLTELEEQCVDAVVEIAKSDLGIMSCRIDVRNPVNVEILVQAINIAADGTNKLFESCDFGSISKNPTAPAEPVLLYMPPEFRGKIIGVGGYNLATLEDKTNTRISIDDDDQLAIMGDLEVDVAKAKKEIEKKIKKLEEEMRKSKDDMTSEVVEKAPQAKRTWEEVTFLNVKQEVRGIVLGPKGRTVKQIESDFGVRVNSTRNSTLWRITGPTIEAVKAAEKHIQDLTSGMGVHTNTDVDSNVRSSNLNQPKNRNK